MIEVRIDANSLVSIEQALDDLSVRTERREVRAAVLQARRALRWMPPSVSRYAAIAERAIAIEAQGESEPMEAIRGAMRHAGMHALIGDVTTEDAIRSAVRRRKRK